MSGLPGSLEAVGAIYGWIQNAAEYSTSIPPGTPGFSGVVGAVARGVCDSYRKNPVTGLLLGGGLGGLAITEGCTPYWNSQSPAVGPPTYGESTPSGQCATDYRARYCNDNGCDIWYSAGPGPLLFVGFEDANQTGDPPFFYAVVRDANNVRRQLGTARNNPPFPGSRIEIERVDGQPDNCGTPTPVFTPAPGGPAGTPWGQPFNYTDSNNNTTTIVINEPKVGPSGEFSIPITIDGTPMDYGPGGGGPSPDFENPRAPEAPGSNGNPADGINQDESTAGIIITLATPYPSDRTLELGGVEDVILAGQYSDAGWYRFKYDGKPGPWRRIAQRITIDFPLNSEAGAASGYQVKFSYGYSGSVVSLPPVGKE